MRRDLTTSERLLTVLVAVVAAATVAAPGDAASTTATTNASQAFSVPASAAGTARVVYAASDTTLDQADPTSAAGASSNTLTVRSAAGANARTLLSFDLSAVSTSFVVTSATLSVAVRSGGSDALDARRVTAAWTSATTWNTAPTTAALTQSVSATGGRYSFSVVSDVQTMIASPSANYGWELRSANESAVSPATTTFAASEAGAADAPVLRLTGYLPVSDAQSAAPTAIYSVRKWRSAYAGSALRVRRASDNAESDIGFAADGTLDRTALLAFVGSGQGYVTKWYDQSGNGYTLSQSTTTAQPRIVDGGTYDGAVRFTGSGNQSLTAASTYGFASNSSWYVAAGLRIYTAPVAGTIADGAGWYFWDRSTATNNLWSVKAVSSSGTTFCLQTRSDTGGNLQCTVSSTMAALSTSYVLGVERIAGTSFRMHVNGTVESANTSSVSDAITPPAMRLGSHVTSTVVVDAGFSDFIVMGSSPGTTDRQRIEGTIAWFNGAQTWLAANHPYRNVRPS